MSEYRDRMAAYGRATRSSASAEARLRARLSTSEASSGWAGRLALLGAAGLAAAGLVVAFRPSPPEPVAKTFSEGATATATALGPEVTAQATGVGAVTGDAKNLHVAWQNGTISLEVEPERGIALDVKTDEALVRVVGTGFDVVRDALGTRVTVRHGKVQVDCVGGDSVLLATGESRSCLPQTAGGMLGRARALGDAGAPATDQLAAVERGLALAGPGPVQEELRFLQLGLLLKADRNADALTLAETMLADGQSVRRSEVVETAARLHIGAGDCAGATRWLEELKGGSGVSASWAAGVCVPGSTPGGSR